MPLLSGNKAQSPNRIVIHAMAEFIHNPFKNNVDYSAHSYLEKRGLSAHILVTPSGIPIRCRHDTQGAYHASGYNRHSLGIEFLVPGLHDYASFKTTISQPWLSEAQYTTCLDYIDRWINNWNIDPSRINRHSTLSPKTKIDPGDGFNWVRFMDDVYNMV